jgi:hypothetical protein
MMNMAMPVEILYSPKWQTSSRNLFAMSTGSLDAAMYRGKAGGRNRIEISQ